MFPGSRRQDHKPAQGKPRTVTVKGLVLTLDPAKLNDWELMESLYDLQSDPQNNALSVVPFLRGMFSAKDYGRIKNRLRDPETGRITGRRHGRVPAGTVRASERGIPKLLTLVYLLHACPDQLAADMRRVYGLSVYELYPLEAAALAVNLPAGSLVWQRLDVPAAWTLDQYLMAARIDQMNMWMWGNADPKKRGPQPEPLPRPATEAAMPSRTPPIRRTPGKQRAGRAPSSPWP